MEGVPDIFQYSYPVLGFLIIGCLRMAIENRERIPEGQFVMLSVFGGGAVMYMILSDLSSPLLLIWGSVLAIVSTSTIFKTISQAKSCNPRPLKRIDGQNVPKTVSFMCYPCFNSGTPTPINQVYELRDRPNFVDNGFYNPPILAGRLDDDLDDFDDDFDDGIRDLDDTIDDVLGLEDDVVEDDILPDAGPDDGNGDDGQGEEAIETGVAVDGDTWREDELNTDTSKIIQANSANGPDWEKIWNVLLFINFASLWLISTMNFVYLRQMTIRMLAQKEAAEPPPIPKVPLNVGTCEELTGTLNQLFGPWNKVE